uniref:Uncharacterized protein n=1 Tax=Anguilla anguilla TaxID=7936 RepID=A0A0E9R8A0_ANGAN
MTNDIIAPEGFSHWLVLLSFPFLPQVPVLMLLHFKLSSAWLLSCGQCAQADKHKVGDASKVTLSFS